MYSLPFGFLGYTGTAAVRWLFMGTLVVTLLFNPLFGLLVSRARQSDYRDELIPVLTELWEGLQVEAVFPAGGRGPK